MNSPVIDQLNQSTCLREAAGAAHSVLRPLEGRRRRALGAKPLLFVTLSFGCHHYRCFLCAWFSSPQNGPDRRGRLAFVFPKLGGADGRPGLWRRSEEPHVRLMTTFALRTPLSSLHPRSISKGGARTVPRREGAKGEIPPKMAGPDALTAGSSRRPAETHGNKCCAIADKLETPRGIIYLKGVVT